MKSRLLDIWYTIFFLQIYVWVDGDGGWRLKLLYISKVEPPMSATDIFQSPIWVQNIEGELYRVFFLTGPPDFQYQNEKQVAANQD